MAISAPIRQALAGDALQCQIRAVSIVVAQCRTAVIAKVELIAVALQVLLANKVKLADQAALENGK